MSTMTTATTYSEQDITAAVARDRPQPAEDAVCSPQKYAGMAQNFRRGAWKHLDKGDLPQASNKAWGLVAETVKAISAHYGSVIHSHRAIVEVTGELARLAGNAGDMETQDRIAGVLVIARGLHGNFYENELPELIVRTSLRQCEELSDLLYQLFWPEGAAFDGNI